MKLVITTKELSPCRDTAKELMSGTVGSSFIEEPILLAQETPKPPGPGWAGGFFLLKYGLSLGCYGVTSPRDGSGPCLPKVLIWRYCRSFGPWLGGIKHAPSVLVGPKHGMLPGVLCGQGVIVGASCFAPWKAHMVHGEIPGWGDSSPQPLLPPYLGWEDIIHHIPDVWTQGALVGHCQALEFH